MAGGWSGVEVGVVRVIGNWSLVIGCGQSGGDLAVESSACLRTSYVAAEVGPDGFAMLPVELGHAPNALGEFAGHVAEGVGSDDCFWRWPFSPIASGGAVSSTLKTRRTPRRVRQAFHSGRFIENHHDLAAHSTVERCVHALVRRWEISPVCWQAPRLAGMKDQSVFL